MLGSYVIFVWSFTQFISSFSDNFAIIIAMLRHNYIIIIHVETTQCSYVTGY